MGFVEPSARRLEKLSSIEGSGYITSDPKRRNEDMSIRPKNISPCLVWKEKVISTLDEVRLWNFLLWDPLLSEWYGMYLLTT